MDELVALTSEYRGPLTKNELLDLYFRMQDEDQYNMLLID